MTRHVIVGGFAAALWATAFRIGLLWGRPRTTEKRTSTGSGRGRR